MKECMGKFGVKKSCFNCSHFKPCIEAAKNSGKDSSYETEENSKKDKKK